MACLNGNQHRFPLSMNIGLNNQRRSCKPEYETYIMKKANLRIAFINGFCSVFLKIIQFRRTKHTKMLSRNLVSSQKTSVNRCYQFLFSFHCCFLTFLGGGGLEFIIQGPIIQKIRNLKYNSGIKRTKQSNSKHYLNLSFPKELYVLTFFISVEITRKSLSAELRHGKSANEGSINFSPCSRILLSGLVKLQDSTVKVKL